MTDLEHDILRLWNKAMSPELIAKYLMAKREEVECVIENELLYEEEK